MPHADVRGLRLFYETFGPASGGGEGGENGGRLPVLLVMGLGLPGRAWGFQLEALARERRVAVFDHRGVGASAVPHGVYHIEEMAGDALGLLDHLGWGRAHVAGISMGGMVALELALQARHRLSSLALFATCAGGGLWWFPPTRESLRWSPRVFFGRGRTRLEALVHQLISEPGLARMDSQRLADLMERHILPRAPLAGVLGQLAATFLYDARHRLHTLAGLPTVVAQPGADILIPPRLSEQLAAGIPGARLVAFPDSGHGIVLQYVEETNRLLAGHFRAAEEARG